MSAEDIVSIARTLLGMPFRHQGRPSTGKTDCAGVICHIADELSIPYIDQSNYPRRPVGGRLEQALDSQPNMIQVNISDLQAGDIILIKFGIYPQHLAVFTGNSIIHAYEPVGKVVEHSIDSIWKQRIVRVYRFRESVT